MLLAGKVSQYRRFVGMRGSATDSDRRQHRQQSFPQSELFAPL